MLRLNHFKTVILSFSSFSKRCPSGHCLKFKKNVKSGRSVGGRKVSNENLEFSFWVRCEAAVPVRALSWRKITPDDSFPRRRFWITCLRLLNILEYTSAVIDILHSIKSNKKTPYSSQKTVVIIFRLLCNVCLKLFGFVGGGWRLYIDCLFVFRSI